MSLRKFKSYLLVITYILACTVLIQCNKIKQVAFDTSITLVTDPSYTSNEHIINNNIQALGNRLQGFGIQNHITLINDTSIQLECNNSDYERIQRIITRPGILEFRIVHSIDETARKIDEIDNYRRLKRQLPLIFYSFFVNNACPYGDCDFNGLKRALEDFHGFIWVKLEDIQSVNSILKDENIIKKLNNGRFIWGKGEQTLHGYKDLYYVKDKIEISRRDLKSLEAIGSPGEGYGIDVKMNDQGTKKWSRITGHNMGRRVAIIIDDEIYMAPVINDKIPNGRAQITQEVMGKQEAEEITSILNHPLEVPMIISEIKEQK